MTGSSALDPGIAGALAPLVGGISDSRLDPALLERCRRLARARRGGLASADRPPDALRATEIPTPGT